MNLIFLLYLLMPFAAAGVVWYITRMELKLLALITVACTAVMTLMFYLAVGLKTADTEVRSGLVTGKTRATSTWEDSYDCMCRTQKDGTQKCSTCYTRKYAVDWKVQSTIGERSIDRRVSESPFVYSSPDPAEYVAVQTGDPVADTFSYVNYLQSVPDTLFNSVSKKTAAQFSGLLPPYPDAQHRKWVIDRVVPVGLRLPDLAGWNNALAKLNGEVGPVKQANVILVATNIVDPVYAEVLRDHWEGVNKNDVVVVIGTKDGSTFSWVRVISWTSRKDFKANLERGLLQVNAFDQDRLLNTVHDEILRTYERRQMAEFKDVFSYAYPPTWYTALMLLLVGAGFGYLGYTQKRNLH